MTFYSHLEYANITCPVNGKLGEYFNAVVGNKNTGPYLDQLTAPRDIRARKVTRFLVICSLIVMQHALTFSHISPLSFVILSNSRLRYNTFLTLPKKSDLSAFDSLVMPSSANPSASAS